MEINQRIGDYEILDELGSGGMGRVFRVRNVISDRVEAMKILLPDLAGRQDLAARFLREIKVLAALNHPNIAALRTALTAGNQLVMIMEYVEGQSLAARLALGPIAMADALRYIDQVLDALHYAHGQRVVHRDVKPANMMLTPQGVVKLTDFGIARSANDQSLTVTGTTTGSLSYMSPEQISGDPTDARSDLYSVGVSLYEMVTGHRPFQAPSDFGMMLAHVKEAARPPIELQPGLPPEVNEIIIKAMAKGPAERFQSAAEFREALKKLVPAHRSPTTSRDATVLASTASPLVLGVPIGPGGPLPQTSTPPSASDHARTVLDTQTPAAGRVDPLRVQHGSSPVAQRPAARRVHPGLYMALGAVLVIAAVAGTGIYLRRAEAGPEPSTHTSAAPAPAPAAAGSTPETAATASPASAADPLPSASGTGGTAPPATTATETPSAKAPPQPDHAPATEKTVRALANAAGGSSTERARESASRQRSAAADSTAAKPTDAQEAFPTDAANPDTNAQASAELDQLEHTIDQLAARAAAVTSSLDRLQQEQARQGLGLRGDIAARHESMKLNLARAQDAIERGDAARAGKYSDLTERDVEALERFLGR